MNVPIVFGSDAHAVEELNFLQGSVHQARRAGLESKHVVNTRSWRGITRTQQRRESSLAALK
jgi:histidinol phosphatase-like PHP family hydrolase